MMKIKIVHSAYSFLLCAFWIGIYFFNQQVLAALMASIFGSFGVVALGQLSIAMVKRLNNEWHLIPGADSRVNDTELVKN